MTLDDRAAARSLSSGPAQSEACAIETYTGSATIGHQAVDVVSRDARGPRYLRKLCNPSQYRDILGPLPEPRPLPTARRIRHQLRERARSLQPKRVGRCGAVPTNGTPRIAVCPRGQLRVGGVETCGSTWACPVCAAQKSSKWARRIVATAQRCREREWSAYLATFTVPHTRRDRFGDLTQSVANAWRRMIRGTPWSRFRTRTGAVLYIRGAEDTRATVAALDDNGWHPHLHVYLVTVVPLSDDDIAWLRDRWANVVEREGMRRPSDEHGVDVRRAKDDGAADYLAKLGLEVSGAERPRSPWAVLERALDGDKRSARAWRDYVESRKGKRRVTLSRSAKMWSAPNREQDRLLELRAELHVLACINRWRSLETGVVDDATCKRIDVMRGNARCYVDELRNIKRWDAEQNARRDLFGVDVWQPDDDGVVEGRERWRRIRRGILDEGSSHYESGGISGLIAWLEGQGARVVALPVQIVLDSVHGEETTGSGRAVPQGLEANEGA
jgi:hypothetical protein